jgi:hypothetical protein
MGSKTIVLLFVLALAGCALTPGGLYAGGSILATDISYAEVEIDGPQVREVARSHNPFGRIALGYQAQFGPRMTGDCEIFHQSSLATAKDRGENAAACGLRWFLFR